MADSSNNVVTLVGTLGADPEVRRTSAGKDVISFSLVTNERIRGTDGRWTDGAASWFKVTAWDDLGRHAGMSFRKGQRVIVRGTMKVETWQARDGSTGKTVALTAQALGHDLRWGTSAFVRADPAPQQAQAPVDRPADDHWGEAARSTASPRDDAAAASVPQPQWSTMLQEAETPF